MVFAAGPRQERHQSKVHGFSTPLCVHGPTGDGTAFIAGYVAYLTEVRDRTAAEKRAGRSVDQTVEAVTAAFGDRAPDKNCLAGAIRAAYAETANWASRAGACGRNARIACPIYSMTSSALAMRLEGTLMPSDRAVLRLITSSNFVARSIGRSPALAPLRMRPT
jgi:hypothetical protein